MAIKRDSSLPSVYNTRAIRHSIDSYFDTDYDRAKARAAAQPKELIEAIDDADEETSYDLNDTEEEQPVDQQSTLHNKRAETSFQQASRQFFEAQDIMKAVQPKRKDGLLTQKLDLENAGAKISKKDRYDYINT